MEKKRRDFFNNLADNWDRDEKVSPEKYRRVIKEARIQEEQQILDVGTGTGVMIPYLLEAAGPDTTIWAIDFAEEMVAKLKRKNFPANVKPAVMDIQKTGFPDNFFDRIIVNSCYPHFEEKATALKEIHRILKETGILIISHPTGRKYVNNLHRENHHLIANDIIAGIPCLKKSITPCGFHFLRGLDEDDFFLLSFQKLG